MASPQPEPFTRISNELLDEILAFDFSKRQLKVLLYVMRKTYGYHKKYDVMSSYEIASATGIKRRHVISTIDELSAMRALNVEKSGLHRRGGELNRIGINKDYEQWTGAETVTGDQNGTGAETVTGDQNGPRPVTKTASVTGAETVTLLKKEEKKERNTTAGAAHQPRYPADFEQAWDQYPKRHGDNPKPRAFKAWNARLREGHAAEEIIAGIKRYAAYIRSEGNEGSRFVKQAATFLGPDKCFLEHYATDESTPDWMREAL